MKKIITALLFFSIFILFSFDCEAATWKFLWTNTVLHIPVGDSLEEYKNKPTAFLYKDGKLLKDAKITYSNELYLGLSIDLVNTNKVGIYDVWYRAFEEEKYQPGTCTGYRTKVSFIVEDSVPPTIEVLKKMITVKRGGELDLSSNVQAFDNYSECKITFSHQIDYYKVGNYNVIVTAIDSSGNSVSDSFTVSVYENEGPVISTTILGNYLEVAYNSSIPIDTYFKATDRIDGDLTNRIVYPYIDTTKLGKTNYTISVKNNANVTSYYDFIVNVVDDEAPIITLTGNRYIWEYNKDIESFDFMSYVKSIEDNTLVNYDNLTITHNIENKVGQYTIKYEYTDGVFVATAEITIMMLSSVAPVIEVNDVIIKLGDIFDFKDYYNIIDDSDSDIDNSVKIDDSNVDYQNIGTYYATIYAINSSGLSSTNNIKIIIEEAKKEEDNIDEDGTKEDNSHDEDGTKEDDENNVNNKNNTDNKNGNYVISINTNTLLIGGGIALGVILFVVIIRRKKFKNKP